MRIYKFLNKPFGLQALRDRRFKVSRLTQLNDPFEMLALGVEDHGTRMALQMTQVELNERAGWCCFSRTWTNPVIWSHYADSHRGLCLGFDVPDAFAKPIEYVSVRPPFPNNLQQMTLSDKLAVMNRLLFVKFDNWRYENEIRLTVRLDADCETADGMHFIDWQDALQLVEVVVGINSSTCKRELERALDGYSHPVTFIKAQTSGTAFEVVASPDPLRNHDDLTCYLRRGKVIHPVEFVSDVAVTT
jgi:hypothetical protein